jgi:hypothetical protein
MRWIPALFWIGMAFGFASLIAWFFTVWGYALLAVALVLWMTAAVVSRFSTR